MQGVPPAIVGLFENAVPAVAVVNVNVWVQSGPGDCPYAAPAIAMRIRIVALILDKVYSVFRLRDKGRVRQRGCPGLPLSLPAAHSGRLGGSRTPSTPP